MFCNNHILKCKKSINHFRILVWIIDFYQRKIFNEKYYQYLNNLGLKVPLYDYHCQQCDSSFTELRRTTELDSPINCPECGSMKTSRSLSCFSVGGRNSALTTACGLSKSQFRWAV